MLFGICLEAKILPIVAKQRKILFLFAARVLCLTLTPRIVIWLSLCQDAVCKGAHLFIQV